MRETFQMAIQELLDENVRGALYDPSRAIVTTVESPVRQPSL
jgi:hypothetical protein